MVAINRNFRARAAFEPWMPGATTALATAAIALAIAVDAVRGLLG